MSASDVVALAGMVMFGWGLYRVWPPLAWLFAGLVVMAAGFRMAQTEKAAAAAKTERT